jgi:hypothetical protein
MGKLRPEVVFGMQHLEAVELDSTVEARLG